MWTKAKWFRKSRKPTHRCPLCGYAGLFKSYGGTAGVREHAQCPRCGSLERHRLQALSLDKLALPIVGATGNALHFAPEPFMTKRLRPLFQRYVTSDLVMDGVDLRADITNLPFDNESFDLVFASHVLEHVADDAAAIREVARVLVKGGLALLPVPIVSPGATVEYGAPNELEDGHVRAPGLDYFERYSAVFGEVTVYSSRDFPEEFQTFVYEDRGHRSSGMPSRPTGDVGPHLDYVPVCRKA